MTAVNHKERNTCIDAFRGIAMLLVVLGHTISDCASDYENSMLLNIIWTLQMPLFMIISGYVTRYSKPAHTGKDLLLFVKKRTCAYLIPWVVWTILVRGIIFAQTGFLNIKKILWNMDSGYWFLFSIWTISMIFGISQFFSERFCRKEGFSKLCVSVLLSLLLAGILVVIGLVAGMSFLCIKLTLYYLPFFYAGFLFSIVQKKCADKKWFNVATNCVVAASALVYVGLLVRFSFFTMGDSIPEIVLRVVASFTGCIALFGLGIGLLKNAGGGITWFGHNSIKVYLCHYLLLTVIEEARLPLLSLNGMILLMANYLITLILVVAVIKLIEKNAMLNKLLFWK